MAQRMSRIQRIVLIYTLLELMKPRIIRKVFHRAPSVSLGKHGGEMHTPEVSDHGGLGGLLDDDHTQYVLTTGARGIDTLGVGSNPIANNMAYMKALATDAFGLRVDRTTNPCSITGSYGYGVEATIKSTDVSSSTNDLLYGIGGGFQQYRTTTSTNTVKSYGVIGSGIDYRGWSGSGSGQRSLWGLYFNTLFQGTHSATASPTVGQYGAEIVSTCNPAISTALPFHTLTAYNYGVKITATTNPAGTTPTKLTGTTYGAYINATGTTEGTQTVYGIYAKASGGDTNYAAYHDGDTFFNGDIVSDLLMANDKLIDLGNDTSGAAANVANRGKLRFVEGGAGARDRVYSCMKGDAGGYSWVEIANGGA